MDHVVELPVNVADNNDGLLHSEHVWLIAVDVGHFREDAHKTFLLNLTLNHQMLTN